MIRKSVKIFILPLYYTFCKIGGFSIRYQLKTNRILTALRELQKWEEIRTKLKDQIHTNIIISEKKDRRLDIKKVNSQINYYDSLTKDMKKDCRPSTLIEFLHTLSAHYYL